VRLVAGIEGQETVLSGVQDSEGSRLNLPEKGLLVWFEGHTNSLFMAK